MKVKPLDIGLEKVSRWQVTDEVHLPQSNGLRPAFELVHRPLDEILRRPSLDERLPQLLQPVALDADLLHPAALTQTRIETHDLLTEAARFAHGERRDQLEAAASLLLTDGELDAAVQSALAMLFRG